MSAPTAGNAPMLSGPVPALATTPEPPYYAVIFTSLRTAGDHGYDAMARRMVELGASYDGFLGIESARDAEGLGLTVSYWRDDPPRAASRLPRRSEFPDHRRSGL